MAQTTASVFAAAIQAKVQRKVLANLRAELHYADPEYAEQGEFDAGTDQLLFVNVPDLSVATTPLTEGAAPTKRALSFGTVTVGTTQYGDLVSITDVADLKSPVDITRIGSERVTRSAKESIDQISRDVIALGGTAFYAGNATSRATIDAADLITVDRLRQLKWTMFKNKIPAYADRFYRLMVSPEVAADLAADADFIAAHQYVGQNMPAITGEIGRIMGFRVIEVVNAPTVSSGVTVHLSLALGALKGWGAGELQTLRAYYVPAGGDHTDPLAQEELLGWKVMFGVGVLDNDFYYRLESAATAL